MRKLLAICAVALIALTTGSVTKALTTTNWVEHSLNPVYTDGKRAYYPTVIKEGNLYKMWYASNYGIRMTTSLDGINWGSPTDTKGLQNANHPLVKKIGDTYGIWYWDTSAQPVPYTINAIRTAISANGVNWQKDQPITQDDTYQLITGAGTGWNRGSYGPGDVIYNPSGYDILDDKNIWNNKYVMYYMATNGTNEYVGLAYSVNGRHWKRYGDAPVLSPCIEADDPSVGWDYRSVGYPTVIKVADGTWHMWFCGGPNTNHGIGYAWSNDGINWAKDATNPIFHKDDGVTWRHERTYKPVVIGNQMWFSGKDAGTDIYAVGYATSNSPPVADAGPDQVVEQESYEGTEVTLDGSGSNDDGQLQPLTYTWTWAVGSTTGVNPTVIFPLGTTTVTLTVYDGEFSDTDPVEITVVDTRPATINSISASPDALWPVNHKMAEVMVTVDCEDICDPAPSCYILGVISNEPINGPGDSNTEPDWEYTDDPLVVLLRAERAGGGTGRIYTIIVECMDASDNIATATVDVTVPHDGGKGKGKK